MSIHTTWAACANSIARALTATTATLGDSMFSAMREAGGFVDSGWFRRRGEGGGFVFLAPLGGAHRYRATIPPGQAPARLADAPASVRGQLRAEAEAFLRDARRLAGGAAIGINGGQISIEPSDAAVAAASGVVASLEATLAAVDPARNAAALRDIALRFLRDLPAGGPAALAAFSADMVQRRADRAADGRFWALAQLRIIAGADLVAQSPLPAVLYTIYDPFGPGADVDRALETAVAALLAAGFGEAVSRAADQLLARAATGCERALESRSVVAHGAALYDAAGDAWAAMRLAELLPGAPDRTIGAADIVLRATHALVVDCVNLGSGTALLQHQAQIAANGPEQADELIETYWFYPRSLRETLLN